MGSQDIRVVATEPLRKQPVRRAVAHGGDRRRLMATTTLVAFVVFLTAVRLPLDPDLFSIPFIEGVVAFIVVRRGLRVVDAVVCVAGPPVAWVSAMALTEVGSWAPRGFRLFSWAMWTGAFLVATLVGSAIGALVARRR